MKNKSSNEQVENKLDILNKVKRVETPEGMYDSILLKIQQKKKKNTIPLTWIRSAAAAVLILIAAETYLLSTSTFSIQSEETAYIESILATENNNILDYE